MSNSPSPSNHAQWAWVGDQYTNGLDGIRILVLGESSYGKDLKPTAPQDLIRNYFIGHGAWRRTYTRFLKILSNETAAPTTDERKDYWGRLAFTNYLSCAAGHKAGDEPSNEMWGASLENFFGLLAWLNPQPDGVIVWGERLHNALAHNPGCRWGNSQNQCWQGNKEQLMQFIHWPGGRPIPAVYIAHPCTPASGSPKWTGPLHDFLRKLPDRSQDLKMRCKNAEQRRQRFSALAGSCPGLEDATPHETKDVRRT
jgi:hypothetical protein